MINQKQVFKIAAFSLLLAGASFSFLSFRAPMASSSFSTGTGTGTGTGNGPGTNSSNCVPWSQGAGAGTIIATTTQKACFECNYTGQISYHYDEEGKLIGMTYHFDLEDTTYDVVTCRDGGDDPEEECTASGVEWLAEVPLCPDFYVDVMQGK